MAPKLSRPANPSLFDLQLSAVNVSKGYVRGGNLASDHRSDHGKVFVLRVVFLARLVWELRAPVVVLAGLTKQSHKSNGGLYFFCAESGFETCFGWDRWDPAPKVLGSSTPKTSALS